MAQPGRGEAVAASVGEHLGRGGLVCLGGSRGDGQRHLTEA